MLIEIEIDVEKRIKQYKNPNNFIRKTMKYVTMMVNVACKDVLTHLRTVYTQISLHICPNLSDSSFVSFMQKRTILNKERRYAFEVTVNKKNVYYQEHSSFVRKVVVQISRENTYFALND